METIAIELQLADLQNVDNQINHCRAPGQERRPRNGIIKKQVLEKYKNALEDGKMASTVTFNRRRKRTFQRHSTFNYKTIFVCG